MINPHQHGLRPEVSKDQGSRQEFVAALRSHVLGHMAEHMAPRYTCMPEDEWLLHLEDGSGYDDHSGTLTDGLRWYAFGCWK